MFVGNMGDGRYIVQVLRVKGFVLEGIADSEPYLPTRLLVQM